MNELCSSQVMRVYAYDRLRMAPACLRALATVSLQPTRFAEFADQADFGSLAMGERTSHKNERRMPLDNMISDGRWTRAQCVRQRFPSSGKPKA